jgi:leucyl-tRNA synthetase
MPELRKKYPFDKIEPKWQRYWSEHKTFAARQDVAKKKLYVLDMFPYPSGAGLHVGHPEGYTATDIYCRFQRMRGFNVLHPMGWDAFGLPAEQYAIDTGTHPAVTTKNNVDTFRRQVQMLGFSYDWDREVDTTDPEYFKWTQWIFLQLYNSYYDIHWQKAMPIALLEDALSEEPTRREIWQDNRELQFLRTDLFSSTEDGSHERETERRNVIQYHRLAYEAEVPVWWCEGCKAVLANEEVRADGTCDRKGHKEVYRRPLRQWILEIAAYAERLLKDLDLVAWPDAIKEQQRNWIGRSEGARVDFWIASGSQANTPITVFTTRPDTLFGATYLVLAPEHSLVDEITTTEYRDAVQAYRTEAARKSDLERAELQKEKTGVFTGCYARNPVNDQEIPIWVADYVLMSYGTGAIMAVPAHDTRDFEFAKKFALEIVWVVDPWIDSMKPGLRKHFGAASDEHLATSMAAGSEDYQSEKELRVERDKWATILEERSNYVDKESGVILRAFVEDGVSVNSPPQRMLIGPGGDHFCNITGLDTPQARRRITAWLEEKGLGKATVQYKLRDWLFSRQRYWGEPIPIVHCPEHGTMPVPESELPLRLPEMKDYTPTGNAEPPLAKATDWVNTKCPQCGGPAKRETNTMPQWAGSCWYYLRYIDPKNDNAFVGRDKEKYWMPVDLYVGGAEHAVLHLLYSRFWHKVLFDLGHVSTPEPFMRLVNQGMILGEDSQKMSKSRGNVIPIDVPVAEFGADTLRVFEMFMGPLDMVKPWNTRGAEGVYRFLGRVWRLFCDEDGKLLLDESEPSGTLLKVLHQTIKKVGEDTDALAFNTAISQMMIFVNEVTAQEQRPRKLLEPFVLLLAPYAPHLAEELWEKVGHSQSLAYEPWPKFEPSLLKEDTVTIVLQVNGKLRDRVEAPTQISQKDLEALALANDRVKDHLAGKQVKKVVVVPGKLVNIVAG